MPRHHKKHHEKKKDRKCSDSDRSRSRSRSRSDKSRSKSRSCSDKKVKSRSHSRSCSDKKRDCKVRSRSRSRSRSDKKHGPKKESCERDFKEWYKYFKNELVNDPELMVYGSNAYTVATNVPSQMIPLSNEALFDTPVVSYQIESVQLGSPFYVREDGVYILFFIALIDTPCQFTIFVNGVNEPLTCIGSNSGAGQIVTRHMIKLKKNDDIVVRNYLSSAAVVKTNAFAGGAQIGNSLSFLMMRIAPLCPFVPSRHQEKELQKAFHHNHHKKAWFCRLKEKLECDPELMVKGFNITGTFSSKLAQSIPLEGDVAFDTQGNVHGLTWNSMNPSQVVIKEEGMYKVFFLITTATASQFSIAVNGVPVETTTQGTNKGAGQLSLRALLPLKPKDVLTIRNHSSGNGTVLATANAGGLKASISLIMTVFKIAPLCKPCKEETTCKDWYRQYELFKTYLWNQADLQIAGTESYFSIVNSTPQTVLADKPFYLSTNYHIRDAYHQSGKNKILIKESGVYDFFCDICTDEPLQYALAINGVPNDSCIFGRDSGANRCLLRQFVSLKCGDVVTVVNYQSSSGSVTLVSNAGGNYVGHPLVVMAFMLHPTCEK